MGLGVTRSRSNAFGNAAPSFLCALHEQMLPSSSSSSVEDLKRFFKFFKLKYNTKLS